MTRARSAFALCAFLVSCKSSGQPGAPVAIVDAAPAPVPVAASGIVSHDDIVDAAIADDVPADAGAHGKIRSLTDAEAHKISDPVVPGLSFVLPAFEGDFGSSPRSFFGITQEEAMATYGVVALANRGDHWEKVSIAPVVDFTSWRGWQVDAVLFEDVDHDGARAPIIIAEYMTGIGPTGAQPFVFVSVYRFKAGAFIRAPEIEKLLDGAADAAAIRSRLAKRKRP